MPESRIAWWVEKDSGVSEAFNKGITKHTSDFIGYMNAEIILPRPMHSRPSAYAAQPDADIVFGESPFDI